MSQMYEVTFSAQGEVRDIDGNLVSSEPIEIKQTMTAEQVAALTEGEQ
jgi:hypothetical protein